MPITLKCIKCRTQHDVPKSEPFSLNCSCGVVIERVALNYRVSFDTDEYEKLERRRNISANIKIYVVSTIIVVTFLVGIGCLLHLYSTHESSINQMLVSKPYVKYDNGSLYIDGFDANYGIVEVNKASGDFIELDSKVYNLLKEQRGKCKVFLQVEAKDKYGNVSQIYDFKGMIDVDELRKFTSSVYWSKSVGMQTLLIRH